MPALDSQSGDTRGFRADERGLSIQIDFLTAMVIVIGVFALFMLVGLTLVTSATEDEPSDDMRVMRSADLLADDYLVSEPNGAVLDRTCTANFFRETPGGCNQDADWGTSGDYLNDVFNQPEGTFNVTIREPNGDIQVLGGDRLALGQPINNPNRDATQWTRYVALDANNDGTATVHRLEVTVISS